VQMSVRTDGRIVFEGLRIASPPFRMPHHPRPFMVCQAVTVLASSEEPLLGLAKAVSIERLCRTDGDRVFDFERRLRPLRVN